MIFQETIKQDLEKALKSKEALRLSVLRMLSSALHNREIEKRGKTGESELSEEEQIAVLRAEVKKRKDAIAEFTRGGRQNLVEKESAELKILERYLPPELSDEEIAKTVQDVVREADASSPKDFGKVMGEAMRRLKGQAGGERVSAAVKKVLGA